MYITSTVKKILGYYESDNPGTKNNIAKILMHGHLAGSGRLVILPVDQGFEHGPARSFMINPAAYDPHYHFQLAVDAGLSAFAAPLGLLEAGANTFAGALPLILKMNSSNSLTTIKDQAFTSTVKDALRLGCVAVGLTIYPGADQSYEMIEEGREMIAEAKSCGLAAVIWSYPRGPSLSKNGETALDVCAYAAHVAALMGAHIIKVKIPSNYIEQEEAKKLYQPQQARYEHLSERIAHVVEACFNGRRLVVFSGGATKESDPLLLEARAILDGGGNGSIIGRNCFQRPRQDALQLLENLVAIYLGKK